MRGFSIYFTSNNNALYIHYLPFEYSSRKFDKLARKGNDRTCIWYLDGIEYRIGNLAV